ncbi:hypothetical protein HPB50_023223 [Hyalomma asiaticum]|uniref:Uncharacterized protein n=1 Tax=Hyalomma asiaticum TaxID=266040 RepID=A0ACB7SRY9_HYAAI|nr:hypothetical protein HPB50_023223 [Hyalomma asiaticum]
MVRVETRGGGERGRSGERATTAAEGGEEAVVLKPSLSGKPFLTYQPLLQPGASQQPTAGGAGTPHRSVVTAMSSTKSKICLATFTAICGVVLLVGVLGHIYFPTIMRGKVAQGSLQYMCISACCANGKVECLYNEEHEGSMGGSSIANAVRE